MDLFAALALVAWLVPAADTPSGPIKVAAISASSTMADWKGYTFGAGNLIDGRVDTSWQPAKNDTLGVGQWVELDLGRPYALSQIHIEHGLQKVDPKLGDLFCRNNRMADAHLYFDDGSYAVVSLNWEDTNTDIWSFLRGGTIPVQQARTVTRYIRLVIQGVQEPVDWKDLAVAEIKVFGRPAEPVVTSATDAIACENPGSWPYKVAVTNYCAANAATRRKHDCASLMFNLSLCMVDNGSKSKPLAPLSVADSVQGKASWTFVDSGATHHFDFTRAADGAWSVTNHTRLDAKGKPAPPEAETLFQADELELNPCWGKLGKSRPE